MIDLLSGAPTATRADKTITVPAYSAQIVQRPERERSKGVDEAMQ
jgi:hypothetical protein